QRLEGEIGDRLGAGAGVGTGLGELGVEAAEGELIAVGGVPVDAAIPLIAAIGGGGSNLGEFDVGDAVEAVASEDVGCLWSGWVIRGKIGAASAAEGPDVGSAWQLRTDWSGGTAGRGLQILTEGGENGDDGWLAA